MPRMGVPAGCGWRHTSLYLLTYSIEQSPSWEANRFSASQEIHRILWKPKVYYRIHKCPPGTRLFHSYSTVWRTK